VSRWTRRVRRAPGSREIQELRDAALDIAEQGRRSPGRGRVAFQTVADCAIIGTAVLSGVLASVHLWKALFPPPREDRHGRWPEPAGTDREPPYRRRLAATGDDDDGRGRPRGAGR
jgi:hypothetical protein